MDKEQRYRRVEDVNQVELQNLQTRVNECTWRQTFHIQPLSGLLNDPNGFSFIRASTIYSTNGFHLVLYMG